MKRFLLAALVLTGATVALHAATEGEGKESALQVMFVQQAETVSYDGTTLTLTGVPSTLWFSDRPERRAGHVDTARYAAAWGPGKSFADDPPNAALAIEDGDEKETIIVTLNSVESDGAGNFHYDVSIVSGELPAEAGNAALFVDWYSDHWPI